MSKNIAALLFGLACSLAFATTYDRQCLNRCIWKYQTCAESIDAPDACTQQYEACRADCEIS